MVDRPLECGQCKKTIEVLFKEIVGNAIQCTEICGDCPFFEKRLHGQVRSLKSEGLMDGERSVCCGHCQTTLESIKMGSPLGCSECYAIFSDVLVSELIAADRIPLKIKKELSQKNQPLHLGKSPDKPLEIPSSSRLIALSAALNEALTKENYEQAAWIRDQIKALNTKCDE